MLLVCFRYVVVDLPIDAILLDKKFRCQSATFGHVLNVEYVKQLDDRFEPPKTLRVAQT